RDLHSGEAVVRFAELPRLRLSGYLWPEMPERLALSPYLWTERVGRGRVIAFAGDPNFRDQWRGLRPLFWDGGVVVGGLCGEFSRPVAGTAAALWECGVVRWEFLTRVSD